MEPTTGRADLYGRVGSLLELGTASHFLGLSSLFIALGPLPYTISGLRLESEKSVWIKF
jgi:hypothetical protein